MCLESALSVLLQQVPMARSLNHRALGNLVGFHLFPRPVPSLRLLGPGSMDRTSNCLSQQARAQGSRIKITDLACAVAVLGPPPSHADPTLESFLALDDARLTNLNGDLAGSLEKPLVPVNKLTWWHPCFVGVKGGEKAGERATLLAPCFTHPPSITDRASGI